MAVLKTALKTTSKVASRRATRSTLWVPCAVALAAACGPTPEPSRFGSDLHEHPARCGMAEYQWLDDPALGDVLEREGLHVYEPEFIADLLDSIEDTTIVDRRPSHRAFLDRFRYLTQDKGELTEATGLFAWPSGDGPFPLLLLTHGTTGYSDACAPSHFAAESPLATDALIAGVFASFGYVVVSSDYLGMKSMGEASTLRHPYVVGEPTAIASLDAGRAAYRIAREDGIALGPLFIAGASQGGHAAGMTVRYQPHYANDLKPIGALYLIPPLNLLGHAQRILADGVDAVTLGNMGAVLLGHASWFGPEGGLESILTPGWISYLEDATANGCGLPEIGAPLEEVLTPDAFAATQAGGADFDLPPWDCMLRESSLVSTSVPRLDDVPALVVTGERDTLVDAQIERAGALALCAQGVQLQFIECADQDHGGAVVTSVNTMLQFLDDRMSGAPLADACVDRPKQICSSDPRAQQ
jgi:acetyl esterase/lipase